MKTERLTLLVTPAEKASIAANAAKLGISSSEYVRKIASMLDADDVAACEQLVLLGPELHAMADRLEGTFAAFRAEQAERDKRWAYASSEEYREQVRQELLADPTINWDAISRLFGGTPGAHGVAAE